MKAKTPSTLCRAHSACCIPHFALALVAAFAVFTTASRAPAQTHWGKALSFDGVDDCVSVPSSVGLGSEFTIEAWVYERSYRSWARVTDFGNGPVADNIVFCLSVENTGRPCFQVFTPTWSPRVDAAHPLPTNQWVHLAVTLKTNWGSIYVNGAKAAEGEIATPRPITRTNNYLGRSNWGTDPSPDAIFDEVRIWSAARTADEIRHDMGLLRGTESNLTAYWKFDDGAGNLARDATPNHREGTLVNGPVWTNSTIPLFLDINAGLPGVYYSSVAWGDYDNDGRLDFLLTGDEGVGVQEPIAQMWRNTGSGFSVTARLPGVCQSSVAWGDYDNDGRLDFLLTGLMDEGFGIEERIAQMWRNTGSGFSDVTATVAPGLSGVERSSVTWGDYDKDGRQDFLLTGWDGSSRIAQIWRNTGSGFTNVTAAVAPGLPGVALSSVAWGDYDADGQLDFLLTGGAVSGPIAQVWRNAGSAFSNVTATVAPELRGVYESSVAWGDYDNDGRLDFLLTGHRSSYDDIAQVWRNTGNGFSNVTAMVAPGLSGVLYSSVAWGDYDNDGRLDFLLTGETGSGPIAQVWRNTASGFVNINAGLPGVCDGVYDGSGAWGDYDNDGRLDLLLTGNTDSGQIAQVWRNLGSPPNTPPAPPAGLAVAMAGSAVNLSWNPASDAEIPAAGLSYNLRVGTTPGGSDVVSPHASATGGRRLPALGNAQQRLSFPLVTSRTGRFYWSVQAIDTAFAGSPFAPESSFTLWPALAIESGVIPGDTNGDGIVSQAELDLVLANYFPSSPWVSLTNTAGMGDTNVTFALPNSTAGAFSVLTSTNLADWEYLGPATPRYEFTDTNAPALPERFYRLRWP